MYVADLTYPRYQSHCVLCTKEICRDYLSSCTYIKSLQSQSVGCKPISNYWCTYYTVQWMRKLGSSTCAYLVTHHSVSLS